MMFEEIIAQIVILAEELSNEYYTHSDPVARLYNVQLKIDRAIGDRMGELADERDNIKEAKR